MSKRFQTVGVVLALFGLGFLIASGVAFFRVQDGYSSLASFSEAQNVTLSYNDDGVLVDRGTPEGAEAIMTLLTEDWGYPVVESEMDPDDPLVNTASEYMFQMATIGYHILHGTQTVVLDEAVEFDGVTYDAGPHEVAVSEIGSEERLAAGFGGYWTDFNRQHPLEGPARAQAWSGTAHGLFGELGVGVATASTLQLALGVTGIVAGIGALALIAGLGMIWIGRAKDETGQLEISSPEMEAQKKLAN